MFLDRKLSILYIIIFFVILVAFVAIMIWEFTGFWSGGKITFDPTTRIYHELTGTLPTLMTFLMFAQLIWGLSFVK